MTLRNVLTELCNSLPSLEDGVSMPVSELVLQKMNQRVISFEDQVSIVELLSHCTGLSSSAFISWSGK